MHTSMSLKYEYSKAREPSSVPRCTLVGRFGGADLVEHGLEGGRVPSPGTTVCAETPLSLSPERQEHVPAAA